MLALSRTLLLLCGCLKQDAMKQHGHRFEFAPQHQMVRGEQLQFSTHRLAGEPVSTLLAGLSTPCPTGLSTRSIS